MKIQNLTLKDISKTVDISKHKLLINELKMFIKKSVEKAKVNGVVLGISGGIDSTFLAYLMKDVFQEKLELYSISINELNKTELISKQHAQLIERDLQHKVTYIDLTNTFNTFKNELNIDDEYVLSNLKARLRMTSLYAYAQKNKKIVIGTDNFNEWYLGYFTKYGDGGCDLLPIAKIKKSDIYIMAKILNIPEEIIIKKPSADLWENQSDEDELGFSYDDFEQYISDPTQLTSDVRTKIENQHNRNIHKLVPIPIGPELKEN
ncbi:NAD(+) synthase [Mycoplasma phocoenae]|uniref:NH(3)-dependent NAD(+) synthetase n=1 Tax=Mycoplasma phocoenae TaxID=754517 RepID=A0A858U845_9MOLU|nr:NAD(+) synthase [Mycoplasma phocoenae]QJG66938.1 NAD(+) synthase [Mycoplasma phocoenae]